MPDFTCALYLGLWHASGELRPWSQLTTGTPAAVRRPARATTAAAALAALQGCEAATLLPSTLHGAWDLGGIFDPRREALHVDRDVYPVLRVTALRARARGMAVREFAHHDPAALQRSLRADARRPIVLVDGLCPGCGGPAPLGGYLAAVRRRGGVLVVDDTQALGILGAPGGAVAAWGAGGGGSLRHHGIAGARDVVLLTSCAKALGAPIGAISASAALVARYESGADTAVHNSPASIAVVAALEHALAVNRARGESLRRRVACAVARLRRGFAELGIAPDGGLFPVQALPPLPAPAAAALYRHLLQQDVRSVPQSVSGGAAARAVFVLTARSRDRDVDDALAALADAPQLAWMQRRTTAPRAVA